MISLGPGLFAITLFSGEVGTVFIVGPREGEPSLLWSISDAGAQAVDRPGLVEAWKLDRAGERCREAPAKHKPGTCGPLYASVGLLTPDQDGRPRFYVSAGYAQLMGATVGHQGSVWRWDGDRATLLWIDWYDVMIDQKFGDHFTDNVLSLSEKEYFKSFDACGACDGRQVVQRLRISPGGVEDLGKLSRVKELDLIDELFWRIATGRPTASVAVPTVSKMLRQQIMEAQRESHKIAPDFLSVGMLEDVSVHRLRGGKRVCFTADDIGRLYFTFRVGVDGRERIVRVEQRAGTYGECPR